MAFNIERFKSEGLSFNGARPSNFQVVCQFPATVPTTNIPEGGRFLISAASLPASLIDEIRVPYFGRFIKVFGNRAFQDWTVTVMNDNDFALRNAFEAWHNSINTLVSNRLDPAVAGSIASNQSYKVDMVVQQFAPEGPPSEGGIIRQYRLVGAFPTAVNAINLAWDDVNRIEQFDVTFSYDYWIPAEQATESYDPIIPPD